MKFTRPLLIAVAVLAVIGTQAVARMQKQTAPAATFTTLDGQSSVPDGLRGKVQFTPARFITGRDGSMLEQKLGELDFVRLKALLDKELS